MGPRVRVQISRRSRRRTGRDELWRGRPARRRRPERRCCQLEVTNATLSRRDLRGVTLVELLIAVAIIAVIVSVSAPGLTTGLATVRLSSASGDAASFLTRTMNRVETREEAAAVVI